MASSSPSTSKNVGNLTMDKAAFLLIRIKRAFLKKRNKGKANVEKPAGRKRPPLLRAGTLPAIICPSLNIIQAQLEASDATATNSVSKSQTADMQKECRLEPETDISKSPMGSPRTSVTSVTSITSSASQHSSGRESSAKNRYDSTKASLAKLARLLTPKEKSTDNKNMQQFCSTIPNIEVTTLRRSGSMDSLLDCPSYHGDYSDISNCSSMACLAAANSSSNLSMGMPVIIGGNLAVPVGDGRTIPTSPSVPAKLEAHRKGGDLPSSPSVPNRLAKGGSGLGLDNSDVLFEGLPLSKAEKKRLEKLNKISIDLQALFVAVEHEQLERARNILSTTDVNVNCTNTDGFTPLDIAVMILDISMAKLLQSYGARETTKFRTKESRFSQLTSLVREAERCAEELTACLLSTTVTGSTLSVALIKEKEKQLALWTRRQKLLCRMKSGFEKIRPPGTPFSVHLEVVGTKALKVKFSEPETADNSENIVTKYKVEWSMHPDFRFLMGSREMMNLQKLEMVISEVTHGIPYYFRVSAGNVKGYGPSKTSSPPCAVPSSWMDVDGKRSRALGRLCQLDCVFHKIIFSRPPCAMEIKDMVFSHTLETPQQQRRHVRKSIKNLFTSTPKFQKTMKRGVYLASLLYSDRRVLVTTEDTLPIMEVDEHCPSSLHNDFHWLMKVACTWEDAKALRLEMEKSHSSSTVHFRNKLLHAAEMLQNALGIQDLGQFYYKPLRDSNDTTVLCTIKYIPDPKSLANLSVRWLPLAKLHRKLSINSNSLFDSTSVNNTLLSTTQSMMAYNHVSRNPLPKGLYVAYVKICSSVELIRVLVPKRSPNILPYVRIRENPHVSCEEWEWIKSMADPGRTVVPTGPQLKFRKALSSATRNLFSLLDISPDQTGSQRIYDAEVVELNPEVSLILLLPPLDSFCSAPGQKDDVINRDDHILLPVQVFEMIHMMTYQYTFISKYSRISSILEMDTIVANHMHREAFSSTEITSAKSRLRQLNDFHSQVDNTWRAMRWLMDVLNFAREKQPALGISLENILIENQESPGSSQNPSPCDSPVRHTLKVPNDTPSLNRFPNRSSASITIKITNSTSSFSLTDTNTNTLMVGQINTEMRRCASTSGLMQAATEGEKKLRPLVFNDQPKTRSCSTVTLQVKNASNSMYWLCTENDAEAVKSADIQIVVADDTTFDESSSTDGISINVPISPQSHHSNDSIILLVNENVEENGVESEPCVKSPTFKITETLEESEINGDTEQNEEESEDEKDKEEPEDERGKDEEPEVEQDKEEESEDEHDNDEEAVDENLEDEQENNGEEAMDKNLEDDQDNDEEEAVDKNPEDEEDQMDAENNGESSDDDMGLQFKYIPSTCDNDTENSLRSDIEFFSMDDDDSAASEDVCEELFEKGILSVYVSYDCSLSPNSVVRLHIEQETNAREIVGAVVEQVNNLCDDPQDSEGFCLVASLNSQERILSDSFQPIKVQNPWTKGQLLVRRRNSSSEECPPAE